MIWNVSKRQAICNTSMAYGLDKRGKGRLLNEIFKKNQSPRSGLLLGTFSSFDL